MRTITIIAVALAVTGRLVVALAIEKPIPQANWEASGMAIPLARNSSSNTNVGRDAINAHGISIREKILSGLDNYEMNTGSMHPFAVKRSEFGLGTRDTQSVPLTTYQNELWIGEISIGTPPQTLKVQIDTGSADTWVLGTSTGCGGNCGGRDLWDPKSSESAAKKRGKPFQLKYADGIIVKGDRYTDIVTIAGFSANPQTFGSAISVQTDELHADGLLGLAFPSVSQFIAYPLFESLVRQNRLINPTFSFKFSSSGAEMYVGGTNRMLYNGDITYTRVTKPGFWQVSMDDVRANGNKILENVPAIFDTGANYIFGDWNRVAELYKRLGGTLDEHEGIGYYHLPCDSFPTLSFTFGGRTFEIPPQAFILDTVEEGSPNCFGSIIAESSKSPVAFWTIGVTFLQGVYSVFDYGNRQVGFAKLV